MLVTCSVVATLFILTLASVIAGHTAGILAWRHRLPQYSRWRWLSDPTYVYRSSYYKDPKPALRIVAAVLLTAAGGLLLVLAALLIAARNAGAPGVCGFSF